MMITMFLFTKMKIKTCLPIYICKEIIMNNLEFNNTGLKSRHKYYSDLENYVGMVEYSRTEHRKTISRMK